MIRIVSTASLLIATVATGAPAAITIHTPTENQQIEAPLCPVPPCFAGITFSMDFDLSAPTETILLERENLDDPSDNRTSNICSPPDPIEPGDDSCPDGTQFQIEQQTIFLPGRWRVTIRAVDPNETAVVHFTVFDNTTPNPGTVALDRFDPEGAAPPILIRESPDELTAGEVVTLFGQNLENPFLDAFLVPVGPTDPRFSEDSALPFGTWCPYEAEIVEKDPAGSFMKVRVPELPETTRWTCTPQTTATAPSFSLRWRWVVRDRFIRPERVHTYWALPSPRKPFAEQGPYFSLQRPAYPVFHGFGFTNMSWNPTGNEFLSVFGDNAYLCVGAFGVCATRVPNPVYRGLFQVVYREVIKASAGSCVGMSATSLLMQRELLQPEDFDPDVHYPFGFKEWGFCERDGDCPKRCSEGALTGEGCDEDEMCLGAVCAGGFCDSGSAAGASCSTDDFCRRGCDDAGDVCVAGRCSLGTTAPVDNYEPGPCNNFCGPPKPLSLFAQIRTNHGVQLSSQFIGEMFEDLKQNVAFGTLKGSPRAVLTELDLAGPFGNILCLTQPGGGHCVTPYGVDGNEIPIYDNNSPNDVGLFVEVDTSANEYLYPGRTSDPRDGTGLFTIPIGVWLGERNMPGIQDGFELLTIVVLGSADGTVTTPDGARWGWLPDGTFVDELVEGTALAPLGPPASEQRGMPLFIPLPLGEPDVTVNARGGPYLFHAAHGGNVLQLELAEGEDGTRDSIALGYRAGELASFGFSPQSDAAGFIPKIGMMLAEEEAAVLQWLGLSVPGGRALHFEAFAGDRAVEYTNDSGRTTRHVLVLDAADGPSGTTARVAYGPFEVPDGATHRVTLIDWPENREVLSEIDLDGDGRFEIRQKAAGISTPAANDLTAEADLSVVKTASAAEVEIGAEIAYSIVVANHGGSDATGVTVIDALPPNLELLAATSTQGSCTEQSAGLICALGDLASSGQATVEVVARAHSGGIAANVATVFADQYDPTAANDSAQAETVVPKLKGDVCTEARECASGFCADGRCCNQACEDDELFCNLPNLEGFCLKGPSPAPALDPRALAAALLLCGAIAWRAIGRSRSRRAD
jgi:uncharacterized repeat protein (TIGR01451 family)